jgi:hypothetical protein
MSDDQAQRLAELEVKRNRTVADLEAIEAAVDSVRKSMLHHPERQDAITQDFAARLDSESLSEETRQQTYREWNDALRNSIEEYNDLAAERERLHVQELILVRMIAELDARIKEVKASFT